MRQRGPPAKRATSATPAAQTFVNCQSSFLKTARRGLDLIDEAQSLAFFSMQVAFDAMRGLDIGPFYLVNRIRPQLSSTLDSNLSFRIFARYLG